MYFGAAFAGATEVKSKISTTNFFKVEPFGQDAL
jgi:hypothetical protein